MADDQQEQQDFKVDLAYKIFLYKSGGVEGVDMQKLKAEIVAAVIKDDLAPLYQHICSTLGWDIDTAQLEGMKARNTQKLQELDEKIKDAEENLGETEVRDAVQAKADYYAQIGDREAAAKAYQDTESKTASVATKTDLVFNQIRLNILYNDWHKVKQLLARAKQLCESGGDWEHKNKLKVYEGVFCMYTREFKKAAELFLDSTATFTTSELFAYKQCIFYAVVTAAISLDRVALRKRVVDAPEILSVIGQIPSLADFVNALYNCQYKTFFQAFVSVMDLVKRDMYLASHARFYMREVRVLVYSQFLESYKSVTLDNMAESFDVSPAFVDAEISELIVAGRLNAKIDKVAGIIVTNRPDVKNGLYQDSIRKGDLLLNRVQKLSRIIDVE